MRQFWACPSCEIVVVVEPNKFYNLKLSLAESIIYNTLFKCECDLIIQCKFVRSYHLDSSQCQIAITSSLTQMLEVMILKQYSWQSVRPSAQVKRSLGLRVSTGMQQWMTLRLMFLSVCHYAMQISQSSKVTISQYRIEGKFDGTHSQRLLFQQRWNGNKTARICWETKERREMEIRFAKKVERSRLHYRERPSISSGFSHHRHWPSHQPCNSLPYRCFHYRKSCYDQPYGGIYLSFWDKAIFCSIV